MFEAGMNGGGDKKSESDKHNVSDSIDTVNGVAALSSYVATSLKEKPERRHNL